MSKNSPKRIAVWLLIIVFIVGIIGYVYFRSRALIKGPEITIETPTPGETFYQPLITISGKAKNTSGIHLGGQPIFITPEGDFNEELVLSPGYNIITIFAEDKFGKTDEVSFSVHLEGEPDDLEPQPIINETLEITDATSEKENAQKENN